MYTIAPIQPASRTKALEDVTKVSSTAKMAMVSALDVDPSGFLPRYVSIWGDLPADVDRMTIFTPLLLLLRMLVLLAGCRCGMLPQCQCHYSLDAVQGQ